MQSYWYPHDIFFHLIISSIALANSMGWKSYLFNCSQPHNLSLLHADLWVWLPVSVVLVIEWIIYSQYTAFFKVLATSSCKSENMPSNEIAEVSNSAL